MDTNRLKSLIQKSNKNQKEIAEQLSISQQRFNFYVTGKREPDNDMLCHIAEFFGVTVDYLLGIDAKDEYSTKFRNELFCVLESCDLCGDEDCASDVYELRELVNSTYPLSLAEACDAAEKAGISIDSLIWDDVSSIPDQGKKSPDTAEAIPGDDRDKEIMSLVTKMIPEQKVLLLALLRTALGQSLGTTASGQGINT